MLKKGKCRRYSKITRITLIISLRDTGLDLSLVGIREIVKIYRKSILIPIPPPALQKEKEKIGDPQKRKKKKRIVYNNGLLNSCILIE